MDGRTGKGGALAVLGAVVVFPAAALAEELAFARQPYLQQLGPRSVIVVWRTTVPSLGRVGLGGAIPTRTVESAPVPATVHEVLVDGLEPGLSYSYRVLGNLPPGAAPDGAGRSEIASGFARFRTAPEGASGRVRIGVFGDAGAGTPEQRAVRDILVAMAPDILLVTGDLVYPVGLEEFYQERFFDVYTWLLSRSCVFPAMGNHDALFGDDDYLRQFVLPANNPEGVETYYSFDFGPGHFVALDTNTILNPASFQLDWLCEDLADARRPWKIVYLHHPLYSTGPHGGDPSKPFVQEVLEPILDEHEVDLVLAGHDHFYERFHPVRDRVVRDAWHGDVYRSPRGVVHVTTGGGGQVLYPRVWMDDLRYSAYFAAVHHALEITLSETSLTMRVRAADGSILDPVTIRKDLPRPSFTFIRGDVNGDGRLSISDPLRILGYLFLAGAIECPLAGDWSASGSISIADATGSLGFLFLGAPPPPAPFPDCGPGRGGEEAFCVVQACGE